RCPRRRALLRSEVFLRQNTRHRPRLPRLAGTSGRLESSSLPATRMRVGLFDRRRLQWIPRCMGLAIRLGSLALFFRHFLLTIIYVSPINPIKIAFMPIVYSTIGVYFGQNWSFFAPNPVATNNSFLVRPISRQEMARINPDAMPDDNWYNLTSPLWERFQRN